MADLDIASDLKAEIARLGPWHLDVQVTEDVSTRSYLEDSTICYPKAYGDVKFVTPSTFFTRLLSSIYPAGLQQRSVLDCGCNCGGWLFCAKDLGAGRCHGFDVRKHWIDQAEFLASNRTRSSADMQFEVCDLYKLPERKLAPFDITIFHGILYHLPDPIRGLKIAADLTGELLLLNTATRNGLPEGMMASAIEGTEELMSGVYGVCWFPTGPAVVTEVLKWLGFPAVRCIFWNRETPYQPPNMGRMQIVAARRPELFAGLDAM